MKSLCSPPYRGVRDASGYRDHMNVEVLERIAAPSYLDNLVNLPIETVRTLRAECQREENRMSYLRRLAQGRHDIVQAEAERRLAGVAPASDDVITDLVRALAGQVTGGKADRLPRGLVPDDDPDFEAQLDEVCPPVKLAGLANLPDEELTSSLTGLWALEREVSGWRLLLFRRLDALAAELTRRYREGEADVDSLLN
jgi:hypothetical protein